MQKNMDENDIRIVLKDEYISYSKAEEIIKRIEAIGAVRESKRLIEVDKKGNRHMMNWFGEENYFSEEDIRSLTGKGKGDITTEEKPRKIEHEGKKYIIAPCLMLTITEEMREEVRRLDEEKRNKGKVDHGNPIDISLPSVE